MAKAKTIKKPVVKVTKESDSEEDSSSAEESIYSENEELTLKNTLENGGVFKSDNSDEGEDADAESIASNDSEDNEGSGLVTNEGWADSIAKILASNKPKNKKTLVLSRAKKQSDIVKTVREEKPAFEVIGSEKEERPTVKKQDTVVEPPVKRVKHEKASIRVKPNILEKDREKILSKIATKGVVQLFNAVRNQQKTLCKEMDRNDLSEGKKEKILKKFDKRAFLDTLMGQSKSVIVDNEAKVTKNEIKDENIPKWSALRDDFMMGAKMKDWDKESVDE